MSDRSEDIAGLSPEQRREMLARKLRSKDGPGRIAPVSYAQKRLWFLDQFIPDSVLYNLNISLSLKGPVDLAALERSLNELAARHETLRTTFSDRQGEPVQVIHPVKPISLGVDDLSLLPKKDRKAEMNRTWEEEALSPFQLTAGPLFRVRLLRLAELDHVLMFTIHHIISDGWSRGILIRELATLYEAFAAGRPNPLQNLPIQYADYAVWQQKWLHGEALKPQLVYWKKKLANMEILHLPTEGSRVSGDTFRGASEFLVLDKNLCQALKKISVQEGVTQFIMLWAAFVLLLHRYTGQNDIVIGSPIANRNQAEIEGLIGFFVNMLVMRLELDDTLNFRELLARAKDSALGAFENQDYPFEKLVEEIQPERDITRTPLFQVIFALQNPPMQPLKMGNLNVSQGPGQVQTARFDIEVYMWDTQEGLALSMLYKTDLFSPSTIQGMMRHFRLLLEGIAAHPDRQISRLPIMSDSERELLVFNWNRTETVYPRTSCVHELFEALAGKTPDAVALEIGSRAMTYMELNQRANQLAHYLINQGVGPEVKVGICVERSFEMVLGILGILKAGGAYVPLDHDYPDERLKFMLEDTAAPVLLTQTSFQDHFPDYKGLFIFLDADRDIIENEGHGNPVSNVSATNLAYVMYTSGSTGQPKGVCTEHRGVVRLVNNTNYVELGSEEVILQFAPISFDASTFEIWSSLLNGGKLVIFPPGPASLHELALAIQRYQVTTLWLTASLFHQMLDSQPESLKTVRQLLAGGETLSEIHVKKMIKVLGDHRLINGYGPTENTTFTTCYVMTRASNIKRSVPIGKPISNTQVYILDRYLQPVPVHVYGELFIGGDGLARGYFNRPGLTAEKFIPDPFSSEPGGRLYRTGDLARFRADGNIEFMGRIDHQVKIRGFRIELGEIEGVLCLHPAISDCVVVVQEENPGDKRLVAYVVSSSGKDLTTTEFRRFAGDKLPEYMIPAFFIMLEEMPLTPSGKIDRKALPAPDYKRSKLKEKHVAPSTGIEQSLADIWSRILGVDHLGVHDNFFELGGHSLLATKIVSQINVVLNVQLPLQVIFECPTIAMQAEHIEIISKNMNEHKLATSTQTGSREDFIF